MPLALPPSAHPCFPLGWHRAQIAELQSSPGAAACSAPMAALNSSIPTVTSVTQQRASLPALPPLSAVFLQHSAGGAALSGCITSGLEGLVEVAPMGGAALTHLLPF